MKEANGKNNITPIEHNLPDITVDPMPVRRQGKITRRVIASAHAVVTAMETGGFTESGESLVLLELLPDFNMRAIIYDRFTQTGPIDHHDDAATLDTAKQLRPYAHWQIAFSLGLTLGQERSKYHTAMRRIQRYNQDTMGYNNPIRYLFPSGNTNPVFPDTETT